MKIVTFRERKTIRATNGPFVSDLNFNPGERYIVDDFAQNQIFNGIPDSIHECSDLNPLIRREMPHCWVNKKVLFYRGCGLGDELIMTAVVRYFREILHAEPYVLCPAMNRPIWGHDFEHSDSLMSHPLFTPIHLDAVYRASGRAFFDYSFFLESVSEWDTDQEQENVYDRVYRMCGIDSFKVSAKYKRPYIRLGHHDRSEYESWKSQLASVFPSLDLSSGYIVVQVGPKNPIRDLSEAKSLEVLNSLAGLGLQVVVVDDKPLVGPIAAFVASTPGFVSLCGVIPHLRLLFSLVGHAKLVIGPDSFIGHVAAGLDIPSIGIYGPISPESRSKYYPNHIPVWHNELCPYAPCFSFSGFPAHKCPRGKEQKSCEVFEGVSAKEIQAAAVELAGIRSLPADVASVRSYLIPPQTLDGHPWPGTPSSNGDLPQGYQGMGRQVEILLDSSHAGSQSSTDLSPT